MHYYREEKKTRTEKMGSNKTMGINGTSMQFHVPLVISHPYEGGIYVGLTIMALLSGVIGNIVILITYISNKNLNKTNNYFIINLALVDLIVTGVADPMCVIGAIAGEEFFFHRPILCDVIAGLCLSLCFCAFFSLSAVSFHRFLYICYNNTCKSIFTGFRTILMCISFWIIGICLDLFNWLGNGDHVFDKKTHMCIWNRTINASYSLIVSLVLIMGPLLGMGIAFGKIFHTIHKSKVRVSDHSSATTSESIKKPEANPSAVDNQVKSSPAIKVDAPKDKLAVPGSSSNVSSSESKLKTWQETWKSSRSLFIVFVAFCICWTPYAIVIAIDLADHLPMSVHLWVTWLAHLHSSITWMIYMATNTTFRKTVCRNYQRICFTCRIICGNDAVVHSIPAPENVQKTESTNKQTNSSKTTMKPRSAYSNI